jgi:Raf kinase inhibitor-like YbhB/YbcL family protein
MRERPWRSIMLVKHCPGSLLAAVGLVSVLSCGGQNANAQSFTLTSSTFKDGEMLQVKNAGNAKQNPDCIGDNVSPPLAWTNVPAGTRSFALILYDPEGFAGLGAVHWVAYGIPAEITGFAEGEVSKESPKYVGGKNAGGLPHYFGPCPPPRTGLHHYTFTLIATDLEPKELPPGLTRDELFAKLAGKAKGAAGLVGLFGKP